MTGYQPLSKGEENLIAIYAMLQFSPLIILEISAYKQFKLMRKANISTTRKADFHPRRFFDFISLPIFIVTAAMFTVYTTFIIYIEEDFILITTLAGLHFYFAAWLFGICTEKK